MNETTKAVRPENSFYDDTPWKRLVRKLAEGRRQCNCGEAYEAPDGGCSYGCSSNKQSVRDEIARKLEDAGNAR